MYVGLRTLIEAGPIVEYSGTEGYRYLKLYNIDYFAEFIIYIEGKKRLQNKRLLILLFFIQAGLFEILLTRVSASMLHID
jgi:hypothetical protein